MNSVAREIYDSVKKWHPDLPEEIFKVLAEARLRGLGAGKTIDTITPELINSVKEPFMRLSDANLIEWYFGLGIGGFKK